MSSIICVEENLKILKSNIVGNVNLSNETNAPNNMINISRGCITSLQKNAW
jgi:hypothetical protein